MEFGCLMSDIMVASVLSAACAVIGTPLCFLLPKDQFAARFIVAPPLGLAVSQAGPSSIGTAYILGFRCQAWR